MILRFTKAGAGARNGEDWINAAGLDSLGERLRRAQAGDAFLIGFDRDREDPVFYSGRPIGISASGAAGKPIRLETGFIGHLTDVQPAGGPGRHIFFKNAASSILRRGAGNGGGRYLTLDGNASHLHIGGFRVHGASTDGFLKFGTGKEKQTFEDIVLRGMGATNIGRLIECNDNTVLNRVVIEDCDAAQISRGFARFRWLSDSVLRNIFLDAGDVDAGGTGICQLIHVAAGKNVVFENIVMRNAVNLSTGARSDNSYAQGDGLVTEAATEQFVIRGCHSRGMGDGGFDLKTVNVQLENCSAYGCKYGIRIWSSAENSIRRCAVENPRSTGGSQGSCIQTRGRVDVVDSYLQAGAGATIFSFNGEREASNRLIRVFGGSIRLDAGAALLAGPAHGTLELHGVAINGAVRDASYAYTGKPIL